MQRFPKGRRDALRWGGLLAAAALLGTAGARGAVEITPWGPFEFPAPVRTQREAEAMYREAKAPVVIAIRFLAAAPATGSPWINHHLACGTTGEIRQDLNLAMVRASTLLAYRLAVQLDRGRAAAAELRAGGLPTLPVRYAGPVGLVLEPVIVSEEGEPLPPPIAVEPHLRVFVGASVPRCATDATGVFGRVGELPGGFLVTASPALELGWPNWSPELLGQRAVLGTDNFLADGFCCGQEWAFGFDSLKALFDYRDYQTKSRFRSTLTALGTDRRRNERWLRRVRDAFGVPERFPQEHLRELRYGSGRVAFSEFAILPVKPRLPIAGDAVPPALADILLGLAWYAHVRADLIAPALLESYDPERKYSFVGWPEEFREALAAAGEAEATAANTERVLEVFGAERKFSFVGEPAAIEENIAFAFAAWRQELAFLEEHSLKPFLASHAAGTPVGEAWENIARAEADALRRQRPQTFKAVYAGAGETRGLQTYVAALDVLNSSASLSGYATFKESLRKEMTSPAPSSLRLTWAGQETAIPAATVEELHDSLVRLYAERYRKELDISPAP